MRPNDATGPRPGQITGPSLRSRGAYSGEAHLRDAATVIQAFCAISEDGGSAGLMPWQKYNKRKIEATL